MTADAVWSEPTDPETGTPPMWGFSGGPMLSDLAWPIIRDHIDGLLADAPPAGPRKPVKVHGSWCPENCEHRTPKC